MRRAFVRLSLSRHPEYFLNEGPHIFILLWAPQIMQPLCSFYKVVVLNLFFFFSIFLLSQRRHLSLTNHPIKS